MRKQILLVDDDPTSLEYFKYILKGHFSLDTALSGKKALERIRRHGPYSVVLTDLYMDGMDGDELLAKVRERHPDTVRILFTSKERTDEIAEGLEEGLVFGFIEKPIKPLNLIQFVRAALEHHQLLKTQQRNAKVKAILTADELLFFKERRGEQLPEGDICAPEPSISFPGRRRFMDTLARMLAQAERSETRVAVLYILLESTDKGLKTRDPKTYKVLGEAAARIEDRLRDSDFMVRIGPAEFAVTLWDIDSPKDIGRVADDIMKILGATPGKAANLNAAIGSGAYPEDGADPESLLRKAMRTRRRMTGDRGQTPERSVI